MIEGSIIIALLICAVIAIIYIVVDKPKHKKGAKKAKELEQANLQPNASAFTSKGDTPTYPIPPPPTIGGIPGAVGCVGNCAANEPPPRLYYSSDVDELITGTLYSATGRARAVYAERTSHGDEWGLEEYADGGGVPGDVGYNVGPLGLAPGCPSGKFDDGIPESWNMPSTPIQWYSAIGEDYYGSEGPTVYCGQGLQMLTEGDHDPLEN